MDPEPQPIVSAVPGASEPPGAGTTGQPTGLPTSVRTGPRRDRRGRGSRGPATLPGPFAPDGVPAARSPRAVFDELVVALADDLEQRWREELERVEFAVEEVPLVPDDWDADTVPLASVQPGAGGAPTRVVLFRRPIELRADTRADLSALVHTVLVEQVAELLGRPPEEVDPRYEPEDPDEPDD